MKRFWTALLATFALCLALVGCGSKSPAVDPKTDFVGTWEIIRMVENGEETSEEDLATLKTFGLNVYLTLNEDGTGAVELFGENLDGTWTATKAGQATFTLEDQDVAMTLNDGQLTMEQEGSSLTFKKIDPSEKAAVGTTDTNTNTTETTYYGGDELDDLDDAVLIEVPIADDDNCRIAALAKGVYAGDPGIYFEVENKTDSTVLVINATNDWAIEGEEHRAVLYETLKAGETLGTIAWFQADEVGEDASVLTNVTGTIYLIDATDQETVLGTYTFTIE